MVFSKEQYNELKNKEFAISAIIESKINGNIPTEFEIETLCKTFCNLLYPELSVEEIYEIKKMLNERFQFKLDIGTLIYDSEAEPWFKEFKDNNPCIYFERYKKYLMKEKGYSKAAVDILDNEVLDEIMDYLGNPSMDFSPRRGLVMGDVQSGKTSTYTGLICKAADAGYKAIIVLTGTIESLRQQTQKRLDEGFVGFDSDHMSKINEDEFWIGVGKYNKKRGVVLTSKGTDFTSNTARNLGFSLETFNDTVLFVVKKNVSVLTRLIKWLGDLNSNSSDGTINYPLLIIDDEADNASVNTNDDEENPTKINNLIRELLKKFKRNNYVGFTATPFANVFINPFVSEDLFPKDFIYSLRAPSGYIGPQHIFLDEGAHRDKVIYNDDCEEVLPIKHKKHVDFNSICSSLEDSIHAYMITNVIRDLRGDVSSHRGMMINISRYNSTQERIKEVVENYVINLIAKYKLYCLNSALSDSQKLIKITKSVFESFYKNCGYSWNQVLEKLYDSNKNIECILVNKDSRMINYDDYENGARLIVVGGLSLSRGLTIEGLCISYLYRSSQVYDVLLQMGRWFGYRKNYDDLFRLWLPNHLCDWYKEITISVDELKMDLERMKNLKQKPNEVGIRIRNDKTSLKITARNKMLSSADYEVVKSFFGDWENTGVISRSLETNIKNYNTTIQMLNSLNDLGYLSTRTYGERLMWKDIPKEYIVKFLNDFIVDKANYSFNSDSLSNFISKYYGRELDLFDIAIIEGDRSNDTNCKIINEEIVKPEKQFDLTESLIRVNKVRELLVNPVDISYGLTKELKKWCEEDHIKFIIENCPEKDPKKFHPSAKTYLRTKDRNPLLLIYLINLKVAPDAENKEELLAEKKKFDEADVIPVGIALAIPQYTNKYSSSYKYKVNMIEQRTLLSEEEENVDD